MLQETYVYYHKSGKKRFSLETIAAKLDTELLTLKGIHGIRWAASLQDAIKALLTDIAAIAADLELSVKLDAGIDLGLLSPSSSFLRKSYTRTTPFTIMRMGARHVGTLWCSLSASMGRMQHSTSSAPNFRWKHYRHQQE